MQSNWRVRIGAAAYLIGLAALAVAGSLQASSNYLVEDAIQSSSLTEAARAASVEPWNPHAFEAAGDVSMAKEDFAAAVEPFEKAVALSPDDYRLWTKLGNARFRAGKIESAEQAFLKSADLAPEYGAPRLNLGLMYLELGSVEKAFQELGTAAELDPLYYPVVLSHAESAFGGDADAIEKAISPKSKNGRMVFAIYLIRTSRLTESVHAFLLSGELTAEEKKNLIDLLRSQKDYFLAHEVWVSTLSPEVAPSSEQAILDGGFEQISANDPSGFGWQIDDVPFTSVARDSTDAHSGRSALKIRFAGNGPVQQPIASQFAFLESGKRYRLSFFAKAGELISGSLPVVVITDVKTGQIAAASKPIGNTEGAWEERLLNFTASNQTMRITLQRPACTDRPCPIFGDLSIDDFSISADR